MIRAQQKSYESMKKNYSSNDSGGGGLGTFLAAGAVLGGLALLGCFSDNDKNNGTNAK